MPLEKNSRNLLYVVPYPRFFSQHANVGGHVAHAYGLTQAFADAGYDVHILLEESIPLVEDSKCFVHLLPLQKNGLLNRIKWGWHLVRKIEELVEAYNPEFCYMRYSTGFLNWLPSVKRVLGDIPLVLEVNSFGTQMRRWLKPVEGRYLYQADHIITISETVRNSLIANWGEKNKPPIDVVSNGVDSNRFPSTEQRVPVFKSPVRIAYSGLIESWYGLEETIQGFLKYQDTRDSNLPAVEYHFYGDGPHRKYLENHYAYHSDIYFHGPQPFEKIPEILNCQDILVNPASSVNSYQSPTKLFEYMASGRPVLSAETPQTNELLAKGSRGCLYNPSDQESFYRSLHYMLNNQEEMLVKAEKARTYVISEHSWGEKAAYILDQIHAQQINL